MPTLPLTTCINLVKVYLFSFGQKLTLEEENLKTSKQTNKKPQTFHSIQNPEVKFTPNLNEELNNWTTCFFKEWMKVRKTSKCKCDGEGNLRRKYIPPEKV